MNLSQKNSFAKEVTAKTVIFTLPWPPTVNTYYRKFQNRMILSKRGKMFRSDVLSILIQQQVPHFKDRRLSIEIVANPPDARKRDLDNLLKPLLDAFEHSEKIFNDDSQFDRIVIERGDILGRHKANVEIIITAMKQQWKDRRC